MLISSTFELSILGRAKPEWLAQEFDDAGSKPVRNADWKYLETRVAHANVNRTTLRAMSVSRKEAASECFDGSPFQVHLSWAERPGHVSCCLHRGAAMRAWTPTRVSTWSWSGCAIWSF
jgi:hypothetical protein